MSVRPMDQRRCAPLLALFALGCSHTFVEAQNPITTPVLFQRVTVFDARNAVLREGLFDVLVRDGKIAQVSAAPLTVDGALNAGQGGVLLPGLLDLHAHHAGGTYHPKHLEPPKEKEQLSAYLYAGVTGILDVGSMTPDVFETRANLARGKTVGPTLWAAGPIFTAPGGHPEALVEMLAPPLVGSFIANRLARRVTSAQDAKEQVDALITAHQPDVIKIAVDRIPLDANRLEPNLARAVVDAAHAHKVRVVAHVGGSADARDAALSGVDALVHGVQMDEVQQDALDALANNHVAVVPTLSVFHALLRMGEPTPAYLPLELAIAHPKTLEHLKARPTGMEGHPLFHWLVALKKGQPFHHSNVRRMRERGITILVGSDSANVNHFPGAGLHMEMQHLVTAGMTPAQVLQAATFLNARFVTRQDEPPMGLVEEGREANLLLVRADPTVDIARMQDIAAVVKGGVLYRRVDRK